MTIRLYLEPIDGIQIEHGDVLRRIADPILIEHGAQYAGYVAMNAAKKRFGRFEPVWQYVVYDNSSLDDLHYALPENAIPGYILHMEEEANA